MGLHVSGELVLHREALLTARHGASQVTTVNVSLDVFLQQQLLVKGAAAHIALESEFLVHLSVLLQMNHGQKLLFALATGERIVGPMLLQVLLQLPLLLEHDSRTMRATEPLDVSVRC